MKAMLAIAILLVSGPIAHAAEKAVPVLQRASPESQGVSSAGILAFLDEADKSIEQMHSIMVVRHGRVVAEGWWTPYDAKTRHELYSLSKSFTSTAVGLAIAEGKLRLDDSVLKAFPDDAPEAPSNNLKAMRLHDLLRMSTGHQAEPQVAGTKQPWTRTFLAQPVPHKPGTHFLYNTAATYMQSAMVQKATGQTVLDYLRPRLFEPLGIDDPTWGTSPEGVSLGGFGLNIRTEDIARFGQLYLQKGQWFGRQLIPAAWVAEATARQTSNGSNPKSDWEQGYGYQFWRCRHGAFRGDGAFGQYCIVMPEQDAVVAITSGVKDMQAVLNLVWDRLLPAMGPAPLPSDDEGLKKLHARLAGLTVPTQKSMVAAPLPKDVSGKKYTFAANDQKIDALGLEFEGDAVTLIAKCNGGSEQRIACGHGEWKKGRAALGTLPDQAVAVSGGWTGPTTYTARISLYETPYLITVNLNFANDQLHFDSTWNVAFGAAKKGALVSERN